MKYTKLVQIFAIFFWLTSLQAQALQPKQIQQTLQEAYQKYKNDNSGKNADYIRALAKVDSKIFGITIVDAKGNVYEIGDTQKKVSIQSISKVFTAALVMSERGANFLQTKIGVNATGLPFNSIIAIELHNGSASNPFVNAGAIQSTSWVKAKDSKERWLKIKSNMSAFAGRNLQLNQDVYRSEVNDNKRNQAMAKLIDAYGRMGSDPLKATTVYTKQCSMNVSAHDLAVMSATIANHGVNPITKVRVLKAEYTPKIMAIMATAGLYDNAGDWLYETGLPAKSGVGGGIIAVVPGQFGIAVVSPRLDKYGNSVRAQKAISYIVQKLHLNPYEH
jgi:glutaminase